MQQLNKGIFISGVLNIILGILHQIVLYYEYAKVSKFITPETAGWISDFLLFSIGMGVILVIMGFFSCYSYYGIKNNKKWAKVIAGGISFFLLSATIIVLIIQGPGAFIWCVHLFNGLLIAIPLVVNLLSTRNKHI